jgi:hypothetical protein
MARSRYLIILAASYIEAQRWAARAGLGPRDWVYWVERRVLGLDWSRWEVHVLDGWTEGWDHRGDVEVITNRLALAETLGAEIVQEPPLESREEDDHW